ncbi:tRNA lysidine(34) synthetase TilS [Sanguibacter sp. 25GB23B1]|uniref:tRNA lysidine(34) synthetase TilS n=1 Tax=unclassified Sanguibacter TaxID=2645534 RepID=UPI0032AFB892
MTGPPPVVAAARLAVRRSLDDLALPRGDERGPQQPADAVPLVLVACSGGADSLALAAVTSFVAGRLGLQAGALVVDHGLQPGSADVAARAAQQCRDLGLGPVEVLRATVPSGPGSGGPEGAARAARYALLRERSSALGAAALLLGHTLDDQAETVLLGLARGSGARSLAGMRKTVGLLRRPFLALRRSETEAVCAALGLERWDDPTNVGDGPGAPLRSRVRTRVLPLLDDVLGPGVAQALARTAEQLREDDDALTDLADELFARALARPAGSAGPGRSDDPRASELQDPPVETRVEVTVLCGAPAAVRRRALRVAATTAGSPAGALTRTHVLELDRLLTAWHGQGPLHLPGGVLAGRDCGTLVLRPS